MKLKILLNWLYKQISSYNVFIPEEDDYVDEAEEPAIDLYRQRYASRLYILLLISKWII